MNRRDLGSWLVVSIAALVVVIAVTAYGSVGSWITGPTPAGSWIGSDTSYWMGAQMGSHHCGAGCGGSMMGGAGGWGMAGSGQWWLGLLWPLLLISLVFVVGYVFVTRTGSTTEGDRAMDLLRERYASGDLSDEEFASRREALQR